MIVLPTFGDEAPQAVWTVGHSTRALEALIALLAARAIGVLADVRRFPGSRRHPQFNREPLAEALADAGVEYVSLPELGGRRRARADSPHAGWHNAGFRGYADYMETAEFRAGIARLLDAARRRRTAMMCAEAQWWHCHRGLIADYLLAAGVPVVHVLGRDRDDPHPYTAPARVAGGVLHYDRGQHELSL